MRPALTVVVALGVAGCGGDDAPPVDLGPVGPPSIAFEAPAGDAPICVSIGDDASGRIPLLIAVEELVLNPPDTCGTYVQCGYLVLFAEGVENNQSAVRGIDVLLEKLADPVHDGMPHEGTGEPDLLDLRVEVVGADAEVLLDHDGEPLVAELSLVTVPECPMAP